MRSPWTDLVTGRFGRANRSRQPARGLARSEPIERRRLLDGLTGQYFNHSDFTDLVSTRTDPTLDFTWASAPAAGVNADHFSVRWTGQVQAQFSENYTFTTTADDGVRLWVDGRLIVDNWANQGPTDRSGTVTLEAGKRYDIRLDYYEFDQGARLRLQWASPSTPKQTIPATQLFASPSGLDAAYYDTISFTNPLLQRTDPAVDFNWSAGTPDQASVPADGFAARWTGWIVPQYSQTYSFSMSSPLGSFTTITRLWVDGKTVIDNSSVQDDGRIELEAGVRYPITMEYADAGGGAGVTLQWSSPSQPLQTVPSGRLFASAATSIPERRVTYTNPTLNIDAPDPGIIFADGAYWMTHTTGGPNSGWPLYKSLDGVSWTYQKNLLSTSNKQPWMNGNYWAPEIHKVGASFILTAVSIDSRTGRMVIAMASSSSINGTYTVRSEPIQADTVHVIDPNIFVDDDGKAYLLWKRDGPSGGTHGSIRIRQLDSTGLNFAAGSVERTILDNETGGWERYLAEAPWLVRRADAYYLFYSGAFIDTSYSLGVARSTNLTSMFTRNPTNPIITSNTTWGGPGHGGFAMDADGTLWHLYHARYQNNPDYGRVQVLDPVFWTTSGWPTFAGTGVSTAPKPGPRVAALSGAGMLTISGDANGVQTNDVFRLVRSGNGNATLDLYVNNALTTSVPFAEVQTLSIDGKLGDDQLILDFSNGDVIVGGGLTFTGGAGTDSVRINAPTGTLDSNFRLLGNGQFALNSGTFASSGIEGWILNGGAYDIRADLTSTTSLEVVSGRATFEANQNLAALTIDAGATAVLAPTGRSIKTASLQIADSGGLDLSDGALVLDYADGATSPLTTIESLIRTGRGDVTWNGTSGLYSSVAAQSPSNTVIGSGEMADLYSGSVASFAGIVVDRSSVLVRTTIAGDTNMNRTTDFSDLLTLAKNYGTTGKTFAAGNVDLSSDGSVDFADLLVLAKAYGGTYTPAATASLQAATTAAAATSTTRKRTSLAADVV